MRNNQRRTGNAPYRRFQALTGCAMAALLVGMAGCASVAANKSLTGLSMPASWTSANLTSATSSDAGLPLNWVETFNDPMLVTLVAEAMNHNNDLGAAATRVEAARQQAVIARSGLLPTIGTSITGSERDATLASPGGSSYGLGGEINWEADLWGRLTDSTRSSYKSADAVQADFDAARLSIAGAVTRTWYQLVEARLQRELSERDVDSGKANLNITERRYQRGVSSSLDVRLARSSLASSQASLISRQQAQQEIARGLEVLLGRYPSNELEAIDKIPTIAPLLSDTGAVIGLGQPADILTRRPDLIASAKRLEASGLAAREAQKALLPRLTLRQSGDVTSGNFSDIFDLDDMVNSLVGSLVQPIFQGGRLRASSKAQAATAEGAVHTYVGDVLAAYRDVENAISAEDLLDARVQALRLAFEEAVASEKLTEKQYLSGTRTIFNLIDAQQRRIRSESAYISAQRDQLTNRADLFLALGGTFDVGPEKIALQASGANTADNGKRSSLFKRWLRQ